jgi:integrase/recombinase XerD
LTIADVLNADGTVKREIYLAAHRVKHGHARTVFVSTRLQQELKDYIDGRKWYTQDQPLFSVYHSARKAFSANTLAQHFFWLYKRAGVRASSHSGRRTFLTSLANKGTAIHLLKTLAGHRSISTTAAYLYSSPSQLRAAVELV